MIQNRYSAQLAVSKAFIILYHVKETWFPLAVRVIELYSFSPMLIRMSSVFFSHGILSLHDLLFVSRS